MTATRMAVARPRSSDRLSEASTIPSARARSAMVPWNAIEGRPSRSVCTSMSWKLTPSIGCRIYTAHSLAANRAASRAADGPLGPAQAASSAGVNTRRR